MKTVKYHLPEDDAGGVLHTLCGRLASSVSMASKTHRPSDLCKRCRVVATKNLSKPIGEAQTDWKRSR